MIPTIIDDDEPDVIDLTKSSSHYHLVHFPIRPPTPFADSSIWPPIVTENNKDNLSNEPVTWVLCQKPSTINNKICDNEKIIPSSAPSSSSSLRKHSTWQRTINKFLKRTKSSEHKAVGFSANSNLECPYNFGVAEENNRTDLLPSRFTRRRVHWIDEDDAATNLSHRFIEYLKLFVQSIVNDKNGEAYLKNCQISLDELDSLINCRQIKEAFENIIELVEERNKNKILEQQLYIENLLSRTVLFSSA